jgi:hypothetical protein
MYVELVGLFKTNRSRTMTIDNGYQISKMDRAMAHRISSHTGIAEVKILRSIVISKEHVRVVRLRAKNGERLVHDGLPVDPDTDLPIRYAKVS